MKANRVLSFAIGLVMFLSVTIIGFIGPTPIQAATLPTVTVGYLSGLSATGPLAIAQYQGYFHQAGIHVKAIPFTTGPAEMDAMASGSVNIVFLGSGAIFLPMKGLGTIIGVPDIGFATQIIASPKSGIKNFAELKGHHIILAENTTAEGLLYTALKSVGLSLTDVHMINIPPTGQVSAFLAGHAPVAIAWAPLWTHKMSGQPTSILKPQVPLMAHITSAQMVADYRNGTMTRWLKEVNKRFIAMGLLSKMVPVKSYFDPAYAMAALHGPNTRLRARSSAKSTSHTPIAEIAGAIVILLILIGVAVQLRRKVSAVGR